MIAETENTQDLLIVFARALVAGKVKTRLIPAVGQAGALKVYRQLLDNTLAAAREFPGQVELWTDQPDEALLARAEAEGWSYASQQGEDLGERMAFALARGLQCYRRVLLVGSDCPVLGREYFNLALEVLDEADAVLGASEDGGYVLLGSSLGSLWARNPFTAVRWGTEHALNESLSSLSGSGARVQTLPPLWDVDEPEDLARAIRQGLVSV